MNILASASLHLDTPLLDTPSDFLQREPAASLVALGHVKEAFAEDGSLADETMDQRLENLVDSVLKTAEMYRSS